MYLKKIVASGFKSFADKINIELDNGITGIVGPNGSGKSNVVDAIRWVLGEQSVKSLRGEGNMTDVIFSGSKSRKEQNVASVTLIFDNTDKYLPLDYTEVSIKRRVYRDGTNEYFINDEKCRLKDITDLLLDTGIAKESFNIISQGKVEEIILNKPSDRRVIFEEAAGVLKYKRRKEEAIRKLDRTHDNMNRVGDIISELETQVNPLKEQRDKALIYKEKSSELKDLEISLITYDITSLNDTYQTKKNKIEELNKEIIKSTTLNSTNESKIEEYKVKISKLENDINETNKNLIKTTEEVEKINGRKNIILERKKYASNDPKLHDNLINIKEAKAKCEVEADKINNEIETLKEELLDLKKKYEVEETNISKIKASKQNLEKELNNKLGVKINVQNKIEYLRNSIENNNTLPSGVRNVLNNPKLKVHDTIGNVIDVDEVYSIAISTSLASAINNIIVDNELCAKDAIGYLKQNNLGRATFFPLNIIKSRIISNDILSKIKNSEGFIDIASNLVKYNPIYKNIIENQLGNVIVVDNIDNANKISNLINHSYRIVTLDGTLLHVGGSLTGGTQLKQKNTITEKYELEHLLKEEENVIDEVKALEEKINTSDYELKSKEDKLYIINRDLISKEEYFKVKNNNLIDLKNKLEDYIKEESDTQGLISNTLSSEEESVINEYYDVLARKNELEEVLNRLQNQKISLKNEQEEFEFTIKRENSLFNQKSKELKALEIEVNRMDVKLDNLLNRLNETYSMTYEKAKGEYTLEIDSELAREKVDKLKKIIRDLGNVNLDAIEEYVKVSERYEFLIAQRDDLTKAEDTLLEIISEMDEVMKTEFERTFKVINQNFTETFKELFKGGNAYLKLTDPDNLLETGIEIIASPPGKSLKSITLLSGGEKTFTAISLLFAILKSRSVPFCVLDEVEAALDEANVDSFGEYITKFKDQTQFILITHKKRTMEYANTLYGITMQESGVSKLVSVKLEDFDK